MTNQNHRIELIQERANIEGVALALPVNYTKEDVNRASNELAYIIYGVET